MIFPLVIVITFICFCLFILLIPSFTGYYLSKRLMLAQHFAVWYPLGSVFLWACSQLILVPLVLLRAPFYLALSLILFLHIFGGALGFLQYRLSGHHELNPGKRFCQYWTSFSDDERIFGLIALFMTLFAIMISMFFYRVIYSDSRYIVSAVDMLKSGRMFLSNLATGETQSHFSDSCLADLTSPWPFQYAFLAAVTFSRPIVAAHIMLPVQAFILCTCLYTLFTGHLFGEKPFLRNLSFLSIWTIQILGCYSAYCSENCLMNRAWQGPSFVSFFGLPSIILLFLKIRQEPDRPVFRILLLMMNLGLCYMHLSGIVLGLLLCLGYMICFAVQDRSHFLIRFCAPALIPNILYWFLCARMAESALHPASAVVSAPEKMIRSFYLFSGNQKLITLACLSAIILCVMSSHYASNLVFPVLLTIGLAFLFLAAGLLPHGMPVTYIYWVIPEGLIILTFLLTLINDSHEVKKYAAGYRSLVLLLLISGTFPSEVKGIHFTENVTKINPQCKEVYDFVLAQEKEPSCIFPKSFLWTARQYDGSFKMPCAFDGNGSMTLRCAPDQTLPQALERPFDLSYYICHSASVNHYNFIVLKSVNHLQFRYLKKYSYYPIGRKDDILIYAFLDPVQVQHRSYISNQLHLGQKKIQKAFRKIDREKLSRYGTRRY